MPGSDPDASIYSLSGRKISAQSRFCNWLNDLFFILFAALLLRLTVSIALPHIVHPDEIFQVVEQAYSFYFEDRVIPWEIRGNLRGWLWPMIIGGVIFPSEKLGGGGAGIAFSVLLFMSLFSLAGIYAAYSIGMLKSRRHALVGAIVAAIWYEFVWFAGNPLNEAAATYCILVAIAVLLRGGGAARFAFAGACLGLAFVFRLQYAPAVAFIALYCGGLAFREKWLPMVFGGLIPVMIFGLVDWLFIGLPFQSMYNYFVVNLVQDKASEFGVLSTIFYVYFYTNYWFYLFPIIIALVFVPKAPFQLLWYVAIIIILCHSLIPHKEYRFVFAGTYLLIMLAAFGSVDLADHIFKRYPNILFFPAPALVVAFWAANSLLIASSERMALKWSYGKAEVLAFRWLEKQPDLCGLGFVATDLLRSPGKSGLHRSIPFIWEENHRPEADLTGKLAILLKPDTYNYLLVFQDVKPPEPFVQKACFPGGRERHSAPICGREPARFDLKPISTSY